ncbi:hypothetical protein K3495_g4446 [Podosphaera aphanis]|nr:hypothetical protein K3495_g4446 [Podosphaera aphanis]
MSPNESMIQFALENLESDKSLSIRAAAKSYGVSEATIRRRQHEEYLVEWILEQDEQGFPPTHARAREMAVRILHNNSDDEPLGKKWLQKFKSRNQ